MLDCQPGKQCCIIDTISLVKLCRLELGNKRAIEWLLEDFCIFIPRKVFEEGRRNIKNVNVGKEAKAGNKYQKGKTPHRNIKNVSIHEEREDTKKFLKIAQDCVHNGNMDACIELISRCVQEQKFKIDEGEKIAAALALKMSLVHRQFIIFLTDDFRAIEPLEKLLNIYKIGKVINSYDILIFLLAHHPVELKPEDVEIALKGLTQLLRNNDMPAYEEQKPDDLLYEYLFKLEKYYTSQYLEELGYILIPD